VAAQEAGLAPEGKSAVTQRMIAANALAKLNFRQDPRIIIPQHLGNDSSSFIFKTFSRRAP
jgi:hypothetical protein